MKYARFAIACLTAFAAMLLVAVYMHKPLLAMRLIPFGIGLAVLCLAFWVIPSTKEDSRE